MKAEQVELWDLQAIREKHGGPLIWPVLEPVETKPDPCSNCEKRPTCKHSAVMQLTTSRKTDERPRAKEIWDLDALEKQRAAGTLRVQASTSRLTE